LFNVECLQKLSSNGQILLTKKSSNTRFNWLEIQISMKTSKSKNRFETGFQQPKFSLQKNGINISTGNLHLLSNDKL